MQKNNGVSTNKYGSSSGTANLQQNTQFSQLLVMNNMTMEKKTRYTLVLRSKWLILLDDHHSVYRHIPNACPSKNWISSHLVQTKPLSHLSRFSLTCPILENEWFSSVIGQHHPMDLVCCLNRGTHPPNPMVYHQFTQLDAMTLGVLEVNQQFSDPIL